MATRDSKQRAERALLRACSGGLEASALEAEVLRSLRQLMPVDAAFFATADPGTLLFTGAHAEPPLADATALFLANEFGGGDVNQFASLARSRVPVASMDTATRSDRWSSARYREIMRPLGLGDELRAALVTSAECWGYLCLHRADSPSGFTAAEVALVARLGPHVAAGLRSAALLAGPGAPGGAAPGVVLLTDGLEPVAVTPEAERLLDLLPRDGAAVAGLPVAVCGVASALLGQERGVGPPQPSSVRVPAVSGGWLHLSASRLRGLPGEQRISVVLAPARAADTVPLVLSAHGLTAREAEVARLVLRGESTRAIVEALHISRYTLQDHLKSVFDKVGVRSRRDLALRLLAGGAAAPSRGR
jgi:DNA-binding CsgD family transcriptional regulator